MIPAELQLDSVNVTDYVQQLGHADLPAYQAWYGLTPDNVIGPITSSLLTEDRCGVGDFAGAENAQWPRSCMGVTVAYDFSSIPADIAKAAWKLAIEMWNRACGITLEMIGRVSEAMIWATDGPLPGAVLAWSELARDRCDSRLEQRYDTTISYVIDFLAKIIGHELGHALGLNHSRSRADLLFSSIGNAPFSTYPGPGDLREVLRRYGEPTKPPTPPTPDKPTVIAEFEATEAGQKFAVVIKSGGGGWEF